MYCPKCETENPDDGKSCHSCGQDLTSISPSAPVAGAKTSTLAIVALVLGILSIALAFLTGIPAIICGIVALVKIKQSCGRLKGKGLAIAGIAIPGVMSIIIVILIGLLVPALNMVRMSALEVKQKAQLRTIGISVEFFNSDFDGYPPSGALDGAGQSYCGALKLCEAMFGQDLRGFHRDSRFKPDGTDDSGNSLYVPATANTGRRTYIDPKSSNVYRLQDVFEDVGPFDGNNYVICDTYLKKRHSGKKIGMPILYYKADTSNKSHDPNTAPTPADSMGNIYNYWDNHALVNLGRPGKTSTHSLANTARFYRNTRNDKITIVRRPYRADSYILISAGYDGEYGTADDICNFEWKYRE